MKRCKKLSGFTLIELLVVVAILALLMAILLPSLGKARASARAVKCGASLRAVGQGVAGYLAENDDVFPPSYVYPDSNGSWTLHNQQSPPVNGYQHWSSFLFGNIKDLKAFTCPEFENGGVPRTNPGPYGNNWMSGQVDQNGSSAPNPSAVTDAQAPYCAFAPNEAIMPRNKFDDLALNTDSTIPSGARRHSVFVKRTRVGRESTTILATEFNANWKTIALDQGSGFKAVAHRSIMPFGLLGANNEFAVDPAAFYTNVSASSLYNLSTLNSKSNANECLIQDKIQLNAVGRNHPGNSSAGGQSMGGTTNLIYIDGHVERKSIVETLNNKEWGSKFFSMDGDNSVR